tara:strand:- start:450 stop:647 length:198 start_codon:yes stop_codon:yes gene_type:complete
MSFDQELAEKKSAEKLQISDNSWAWVLPEIENGRKMIAYARQNKIVWIHPEYQNGQNNKKEKQKR